MGNGESVRSTTDEHKTRVNQELGLEPVEQKGKRLSPFKAIRAADRGCPNCTNVTPKWDGKGWACPLCGYHFQNPPTFVSYIRCSYCGDEMHRTATKRCRRCVAQNNSLSDDEAAVNRYQAMEGDNAK